MNLGKIVVETEAVAMLAVGHQSTTAKFEGIGVGDWQSPSMMSSVTVGRSSKVIPDLKECAIPITQMPLGDIVPRTHVSTDGSSATIVTNLTINMSDFGLEDGNSATIREICIEGLGRAILDDILEVGVDEVLGIKLEVTKTLSSGEYLGQVEFGHRRPDEDSRTILEMPLISKDNMRLYPLVGADTPRVGDPVDTTHITSPVEDAYQISSTHLTSENTRLHGWLLRDTITGIDVGFQTLTPDNQPLDIEANTRVEAQVILTSDSSGENNLLPPLNEKLTARIGTLYGTKSIDYGDDMIVSWWVNGAPVEEWNKHESNDSRYDIKLVFSDDLYLLIKYGEDNSCEFYLPMHTTVEFGYELIKLNSGEVPFFGLDRQTDPDNTTVPMTINTSFRYEGGKTTFKLDGRLGGGVLEPEPEPEPEPIDPEDEELDGIIRLTVSGEDDAHAELTLPIGSTIDWGDGTVTTATETSNLHSYVGEGPEREIVIDTHGAKFPIDQIDGGRETFYILGYVTGVDHWGIAPQQIIIKQHRSTITHLPPLPSSVRYMRSMFADAKVSPDLDLSGWDTSKVVDMSYLASGNRSFNVDLSSWGTSSVINYDGFDNTTDAWEENRKPIFAGD